MAPRILVSVFILSLTAAALAAPSAPANLQASVTGTTVSLSWTPTPGAASYLLEAGSTPGQSNLASVSIPATPSYVATGVPGGVYYVRVRAVDASGASAASNEVTVVVGLPGGGGSGQPCTSLPPDPPTRLRGTVEGTQVSLWWEPATTGCAATNFIILAGSAPGTSNLAQIPVPSPTFSGAAPDGIYFVTVAAANAWGVSPPSGGIVVVVAAANAGGRVGFNTATPAIVADEQGNAVLIGEVVNRSLTPAVFIEVTAAIRITGDQTVSAGTTFLRGQPRRLSATGTIDDSALAPGEIGCFYLPTSIPAANVRAANLNLAHESFASTPMRANVDVVDIDRSPGSAGSGSAVLAVAVVNYGAETTAFTLANLYVKRGDGRAVGCDFAFVPTEGASLAPGQVSTFTAVTHAPESFSTAIGWAHWQEAGDPLAALAVETYQQLRQSVVTAAAKRQALLAWQGLQQQRRALARQAGW
jgi:hypothetical protein